MVNVRDILESIAHVREDRFITGMAVGLGIGAVVGGAVALLLAPRSGHEMRQLISERSSELVERAKSRAGIGGKVTEG
jgi:gas vesicle protein